MKATIFVVSGEVWAAAQKIILRSDGIGSCVVVAAYDKQRRIGALAHIMLPGRSLKSGISYNTKYAQDAIEDMLFKMCRLGTAKDCIEACLVGGANVLNDKNDTICVVVISSVSKILQEHGIRVVAKALGGTTRRWASLDIEEGKVYYTEGDSEIKLLYQWGGGEDE